MQYTLSILVENQAGVLSKISGLFSRRGFNIDSLAVGVTQDPSVSRITIVANGDEYIVEQLEKQLNKLIPVIKVKRLNEGEFISRELVLIKVHCAASKRAEIVKRLKLCRRKSLMYPLRQLPLSTANVQAASTRLLTYSSLMVSVRL